MPITESKFTVGLIGAVADISDAHLDAINNNPHFSLKAVCDLKEQKLKNKYDALKNVYQTTDYKTLLKDKDINVIVICTPNDSHAAIAIAALNADKHVLCEKPMTISTEQSNEVLRAMKHASGVFAISYHFEFFPEVQFFAGERHKFANIESFRFKSSEHLSPSPGKEWNYVKHSGGVWLDWAPNAISVLKKIITKNNYFKGFKILDAKLDSSLGLEIETNVYVELFLDDIKGELILDWEADIGEFIAQTTFWDSNGIEIQLDHATNCMYVNKEEVWSGKDLRYHTVYEDFAQRINSNKSNIEQGIFTAKLIDKVFKW